MHSGNLLLKELLFRPVGFALGALAVAAATGCLVGARGFLAAHDRRTDALAKQLEERSAQRMAELRDEARKFSKNLGFNAMVIPRDQDIGELYAEDRSSSFFTAAEAASLGEAKLETLNHLLPILRQRVRADALGGDVIVVGVKGEIYIKAPRWQKPIEKAVEPGKAHVGYAVHRRLGLAKGDCIDLRGKRLRVERLIEQQGTDDDISILVNLADAQSVLGRQEQVSAILALTCTCAEGKFERVQAEVAAVLPAARVVEFARRARARFVARTTIHRKTEAQIEDLRRSRAEIRRQAAAFSRILVLAVAAGTVVLLAVLSVGNARERRPEVAVLRALGMPCRGIAALFLCKALLTGLCGGILGVVSATVAVRLAYGAAASAGFSGTVAAGAVLVATGASVLPAMRAAREDPATILNRE
ncbi:MAG: hypothetical protein JXR37_16605 [Kiritimatiellae bacterium]|nr:hypothetical protein [Kiritimatiellia bacterium]